MQFGNRKSLYHLQYIKSTAKKNLNSISQRIRETKEEISKINADIEKQKQIENKEEFINRKL